MAHEVARNPGGPQQRCPAMRRCNPDAVLVARGYRHAGIASLGVVEERTAVGPATPARGGRLPCIAGDTAPASARIVQTRYACGGVSLVGNRPAHAGRQSRVRAGKSGYRALRHRSWRDHLERPGKESAAACRQRLTFLRRSALVITDTELKLIAALAIIGLSSK